MASRNRSLVGSAKPTIGCDNRAGSRRYPLLFGCDVLMPETVQMCNGVPFYMTIFIVLVNNYNYAMYAFQNCIVLS